MKSYPEQCVEWPGARDRYGYGRLGRMKAHQMMFELFVGPIPNGLSVLHSCDNPACINPAHLRVGTHAENMAEMRLKGRARMNFRTILTPEAVRAIRASKSILRVLAAKYGVSVQAISDARRGTRWGHVK